MDVASKKALRHYLGVVTSLRHESSKTVGWIATNEVGFGWWNRRGKDLVELRFVSEDTLTVRPGDGVVFEWSGKCAIHVVKALCTRENIQLALSYAKLNPYIAGTVTGWRNKCDRHVLSLVIGDGEIDQETTMLLVSSINEFLSRLPKRERRDVAYGWMMDRWVSPRMKKWLARVSRQLDELQAVKNSFTGFIPSSDESERTTAPKIPASITNEDKQMCQKVSAKGEKDVMNDEDDVKHGKIATPTFVVEADGESFHKHSNTVRGKYSARLYKKAADGFLQTLGKIQNNPARTKKRLIWELIQNAKDVPNRFGKVSIRISLRNGEFVFSHNGDAFTDDDFIGLVQQTSSKDSQNSDESVTGKFGTGFISTYLLSKTIRVKGVAKVGSRYRRFDTVLNRTASNSEEMAEVFARDGNIVEKIFSTEGADWIADYENRSESDYATCFIYGLTTEASRRYAREGINDLIHTLPITLVNQERIKSVQVEIDDKICIYSASHETDVSQAYSIVRVFIQDGADHKTISFLSLRQEGVRITAPIEEMNGVVIVRPPAEDTPKLLRDFPLIGSERFYFPYYLNGERFNPTEDRDGLYLNGEENQPAIENRKILENASAVVLGFNRMLLQHHPRCRVFMASSRKPEADMQEQTPSWFEGVQREWRSGLLCQELLEGDNTEVCNKVSELCLPFMMCRKVSPTPNDVRFYDLVRTASFPIRDHCRCLPKTSEYREWASVIEHERSTWGELLLEYSLKDMLNELESLGSIGKFSSRSGMNRDGAIAWMNNLICLCVGEGAEALEELKKASVFPNELGEFKKVSELVTDKGDPIPSSLRAAYDCCVGGEEKLSVRMIDPSITVDGLDVDIFGLKQFVTALERHWIDDAKARMSVPIVLLLLPDSIARDTNNKMRREKVAHFSKVLGFVAEERLDSIECEYPSLWEAADRKWAHWALESLDAEKNVSREREITLEDRIDILAHLDEYSARYRIDNLNACTVFPCQDGGIRSLEGLLRDDGIPESIKSMYDDCLGKKLREKLLVCDFRGFSKVPSCSVRTISDELGQTLANQNDKLPFALKMLQVVPRGNAQYGKLRDYAIEMFPGTVARCESEDVAEFDWTPSVEQVIRGMIRKIGESADIGALGKTCKWLDDLVLLVRHLDNDAYSSILEEKDCLLFVNQSGRLCSKSHLYRDVDLKNYEWLKALAAAEPLKVDYRKRLLSTDSSLDVLLSDGPYNFDSLTAEINKFFKDFRSKGYNPEEEHFRDLVFELNERCKTDPKLSESLDAYCEIKDALLSRSLGDEKMGMLYRLDQKLPDGVLEQLLSDEVDISNLVGALKKSGSVVVGNEKNTKMAAPSAVVSVSDDQYGGLSNELKSVALLEAKRMVKEKLEAENFVFEQGLCEKEFSLVNGVTKEGVEYPLVVHSYLDQKRQFQLSPADWEQLTKPRSMLWVRTQQGVGCVPFRELVLNREKIDLSFSTTNLELQDRIGALASVMRWFKGLHFDFGSLIQPKIGRAILFDLPEHSVSDEQKAAELLPDPAEGVLG